MTDPDQVTGVQWGVVVPGLLLAAVGAAAYLGVARTFWRGLWPRPELGFGLLWLGLAGVLTGFALPVVNRPWGLLLALVAFAAGVVGLLSFFWMARPLQPRWFREDTR